MTGFVLCDEYYENPVFSEDSEKNLIMWRVFEEEYEIRQELDELYTQFGNFLHEKDYLDDARETRDYELSVCRRINVLHNELEALLDGTGITWEEYEMAKKNLH